ncbi:fucose 4-O-acetylase-like acetyltransferase [Planifilum fimeticola]|jgi:fucose 4-O-acetylase-like acetyltransferase|uniref:Fucose 4-O-acetylase-like acetyltransferase n=1 Tax=Planifilum fimeticola TaxID=201975 RepID=A0A2T0LEJ5_9BACL|nr:acyltransferase family protein [Planifilum fimeticola]PRX40548.1 fucose 4-O-acetylase-like acetyltransferase [Planifilum fimeticola]
MEKGEGAAPQTTQKKQKTRDPFFDNAKFVLITLVVIGHAYTNLRHDNEIVKTAYLLIYSFHMPLFILISGYFTKNYNKPGYMQKTIATLLVPYFIFEVIYSVFRHYLYQTENLNLTILIPYWSMWFLLSLFLWRMLLPYFLQFKRPLLLCFLVAVLAGYVEGVDQFLSLQRTLGFFPFFLLGFYLQKRHFDVLLNWFTPRRRLLSVGGIALVFLLLYYLEPLFPTREWMLYGKPYAEFGHPEWYAGIFRIGAMGLALMMSVFVLSLIPRRKTFFTELGSRSMYVYLLHGFFIHPFRVLVPEDAAGPVLYILVTLAAIALTLFLSSRFVQKVTQPLVQPKIRWIFRKNRYDQAMSS